jgi:hypothetical protein
MPIISFPSWAIALIVILSSVALFSAISIFFFYRKKRKLKEQAYQKVQEHSSGSADRIPVEPSSEIRPVPYFSLSVPVLSVPEAVVASEIPETSAVKAR